MSDHLQALRAMIAAPVTRRRVIIWPDYYDDADDHGFGWSGIAATEADAVAAACVECDEMNDREPGTCDPATIDFTDSEPDYREMYLALCSAIRNAP